MDSSKVRDFFSRGARHFDSIYTGEKPSYMRVLDRLFRQDMFQRFQLTLDECGDLSGMRVLDIGCGSGQYLIRMAQLGATVTGLDFSGEMVKLAKESVAEAGLEDRCQVLLGDFLSVPLEGPFDVSMALGFFDYIADPGPFLARAHEVTAKKLIATFPKRWTYRTPLRKLRLGLLGCPVYFYDRKQVEALMGESGLAVRRFVTLPSSYWVVAEPS